MADNNNNNALRDLLSDTPDNDAELDDLLGDDLVDDVLDAASDQAAAAALPTPGYVEPLMDFPPNQATMECLRGPCIHHWHLTWRMPSPGCDDLDIRVGNNRHCTCGEGANLSSKNVFRCTRWWPAQLGLVPPALRGLLRPALRRFWERRLARAGYDLSWRVWPDDVFEMTDRPEYRDAAGLSGEKRPPTVHDFQKRARSARRKGNGTK
jgi:hypothetical protein